MNTFKDPQFVDVDVNITVGGGDMFDKIFPALSSYKIEMIRAPLQNTKQPTQ